MNPVYIDQAETSVAREVVRLDRVPSIAAPQTKKIQLAHVAIAAQIALACAFVLAQADLPYRWDSVAPALTLH